ncbi:MAG: hypothetical protein HQ490_05200 [Lutibacter sp.]|nr:hypothetical protein [Lutibacter sp.]
MEKNLRIEKLKEIQNIDTPYMTGIRISYKGDVREFNAYKIPLEFLIYNKLNGRIGSRVKSFEKQYHELNPEIIEHKEKIEQFLYDSKKDRNKSTQENIVEIGQQRHGIVTSSGIIIDGNRRSMLLNKIYKEREAWHNKGHNVENCKYFIAIILPDDADPKEIQRLETSYQMGEDEKLDYNPIEKYLKIKDLQNYGFEPIDIAKMMGEDESQIKIWIEIMSLMDKYLSYLSYDGIYTRLEKTEGPLVDLNNYIRRYSGNGSDMIQWDYDEMDINEMMLLCFDYIRARYEGKDFRIISKPSKKESIFCKSKVLWQDFLKSHQEKMGQIEEPSVEEIRQKNPSVDMSKLLEARDADWASKAKGLLLGNLNIASNKLNDLNYSNQPLELVNRAYNALESINTEVEQFFNNEELYEKLQEINKMTFILMKAIKKYKPEN